VITVPDATGSSKESFVSPRTSVSAIIHSALREEDEHALATQEEQMAPQETSEPVLQFGNIEAEVQQKQSIDKGALPVLGEVPVDTPVPAQETPLEPADAAIKLDEKEDDRAGDSTIFAPSENVDAAMGITAESTLLETAMSVSDSSLNGEHAVENDAVTVSEAYIVVEESHVPPAQEASSPIVSPVETDATVQNVYNAVPVTTVEASPEPTAVETQGALDEETAVSKPAQVIEATDTAAEPAQESVETVREEVAIFAPEPQALSDTAAEQETLAEEQTQAEDAEAIQVDIPAPADTTITAPEPEAAAQVQESTQLLGDGNQPMASPSHTSHLSDHTHAEVSKHNVAPFVSKIPTALGSPKATRRLDDVASPSTRPLALSKLATEAPAASRPVPLASMQKGSTMSLLNEQEALSERIKEMAAGTSTIAEGVEQFSKVPFRLEIEEVIDAHFRGTFISKSTMRIRFVAIIIFAGSTYAVAAYRGSLPRMHSSQVHTTRTSRAWFDLLCL
jgi:hypothetical protein